MAFISSKEELILEKRQLKLLNVEDIEDTEAKNLKKWKSRGFSDYPRPFPEYNGKLFSSPQGTIYLIDEGCKRGFTNWKTFDRVFKPERVWEEEAFLDAVQDGLIMPNDAIVVHDMHTWFLIDRDSSGKIIKRGIPSMDVVNKYQLRTPSAEKHTIVPRVVLQGLPDGPILH